jgi:hypothetical protein
MLILAVLTMAYIIATGNCAERIFYPQNILSETFLDATQWYGVRDNCFACA